MNNGKCLTAQEKQLAIQLAEQLLTSPPQHKMRFILNQFEQHTVVAHKIMDFWKNHNSLTQQALNILITEKCRVHLQKCMNMRSVKHP